MNSAPTSLKVFGLYMMLVPGLGLMTMPATLLDLFGLSHGGQLWMARVIGLLAFIIGTYQYSIAKQGLATLYRVTVAQRYFAALLFAGLWVNGEAGPLILLFALIDTLGASWTLLAVNRGTQRY
ncbi:hypothetical protein [Pseudomonas aeruginosa]|uniref:hypothetical protein n=1 Tax=Pseudomonas aeruginosa TaxID=287 RepID=UPI0020444628|nr:hypothetical protein [Pseudomonas aeruginosa]MCM3889054.1 hypothetical protein [Pseudomonas aeruginosa]MCM3939790.1 hypothetical protein [Pseudomonas aeruginosa]MCM3952134.1 hypothetical protein [Pseudomonas aeruginosa]MCM3957844.1 hypothetical protein [Pseudomonas aeruginosa]MCM3963908.1 hypothetical protein [Pseudomonas aeruginosa]